MVPSFFFFVRATLPLKRGEKGTTGGPSHFFSGWPKKSFTKLLVYHSNGLSKKSIKPVNSGSAVPSTARASTQIQTAKGLPLQLKWSSHSEGERRALDLDSFPAPGPPASSKALGSAGPAASPNELQFESNLGHQTGGRFHGYPPPD